MVLDFSWVSNLISSHRPPGTSFISNPPMPAPRLVTQHLSTSFFRHVISCECANRRPGYPSSAHPCSVLLVEASRTPALMVIRTMLIMLLGGCHFVSGRACREHAIVAFCVAHNVFSSGCRSRSRFHSLRRRRG
jgi:hypothetical protein